MSSDTPSASATIGDNNSNVNVEINQNFGPSLEADFSSAVSDLEKDIERYNLPIEYAQNLVRAEKILRDMDLLEILDIMDCRRKPHSHDQKIRALLSFFINAMIIDSHFQAPNRETIKSILKNKPSWLFQVPRGESECLTLHLTEIINLLRKIPASEIKNGTLFLSKLKHEINCDACVGKELETECIRGILRDWTLEHSSAFGNEPVEDFFAGLDRRSLTAKCGNCISNVQETEKAKKIFEVTDGNN